MRDRIQAQLDKVFAHIEVYNREMGQVQADMKNIKGDICQIKDNLRLLTEKLSEAITKAQNSLPAWATIAISILMGLLGIAVGFVLK